MQQLHNAPLAAESDDYDGRDSAYEGSVRPQSMISLSESIIKYRRENGRRYHAYKDGKYYLPNDEGEQDRLDLQHHLFALTFDGTGTGIWAIEFADEHPESQVIGVDLSPTQPVFLPPNLRFQVDDIEDTWMFSQKFDFIHARMMAGSIVDWPRLFGQIMDNLNPGCYFQAADVCLPLRSDDGTYSSGSQLAIWAEHLVEAGAKFGAPLDSVLECKQQMIAAGFEDVVEIEYKWPTNRWPKDPKMKELGMWNYENMAPNILGFSLALFTRILGWDLKRLEALDVEVQKELKDTTIHAYIPIYVVWGRKPESPQI